MGIRVSSDSQDIRPSKRHVYRLRRDFGDNIYYIRDAEAGHRRQYVLYIIYYHQVVISWVVVLTSFRIRGTLLAPIPGLCDSRSHVSLTLDVFSPSPCRFPVLKGLKLLNAHQQRSTYASFSSVLATNLPFLTAHPSTRRNVVAEGHDHVYYAYGRYSLRAAQWRRSHVLR